MTEICKNPLNISALRTLNSEQKGISLLIDAFDGKLGESFAHAVEIIKAASGRVVVTGVGKSGHIGAKIAATLASTGTPSFFLHAAEAGHGDLGMITGDDVIIALSWSGESAEFSSIIAYKVRFSIPVIAITSKPESALGKRADICLVLPKVQEACPHNLAPTTSTIVQMALGDALAIALLETGGFTAGDFSVFHPGGQLGANLKTVGDIMHRGKAVPVTRDTTLMTDAIITMSEKGFGCLGVIDENGTLTGVITDGDLRRHMQDMLLEKTAGEVMTRDPFTITTDRLAARALEIMNSSGAGGINALFVVKNAKPVGIVHVHDLLRIGVA